MVARNNDRIIRFACDNLGIKYCSKCDEFKPHAEFGENLKRWDLLARHCNKHRYENKNYETIMLRYACDDIGIKWCGTCKSFKQHVEFPKSEPEWDGLFGRCKECCKGNTKKPEVQAQIKASYARKRQKMLDDPDYANEMRQQGRKYYYKNRLKITDKKMLRITCNNIGIKYCSGCDEYHPLSEFGSAPTTWDGLKNICRKAYALSAKNRRQNDPLYNLTQRLRCLVYNAIKNCGYSKKSHTHEILGIGYEDLMEYLGEIKDGDHIDHIVPVSWAETEAEAVALNHYTNLRIKEGIENIIKNDNPPLRIELPEDIHPLVMEIFDRHPMTM